MDQLPPPIVVEILNRLDDSLALTRCRLTCNTLNSLAREVKSINLHCTLNQYLNSDTPNSTSFKSIVLKLISSLESVESVTVVVDDAVQNVLFEGGDLWLADECFVRVWLPLVADTLTSLSISDLWTQACRRPSPLLSLLSNYCYSLLQLELKNTWLSVDGLKPMPILTCLTLESVRLDDENLNKVNDCFPSLEVLNLIWIEGLNDPTIRHPRLKTFHWTVSSLHDTDLTIVAPNLVSLKLKCARPWRVRIEAPLLSHFHLAIDLFGPLGIKELYSLRTLSIDSSDLCRLIMSFTAGRTTKYLILDSHKRERQHGDTYITLEMLFIMFPNVTSLTLRSGAWSELITSGRPIGWDTWEGSTNAGKELKEIKVYLLLVDPEITSSSMIDILEKCENLSDMCLLIHSSVTYKVQREFISRCMAYRPQVRWRWGIWEEEKDDAWISNGIK